MTIEVELALYCTVAILYSTAVYSTGHRLCGIYWEHRNQLPVSHEGILSANNQHRSYVVLGRMEINLRLHYILLLVMINIDSVEAGVALWTIIVVEYC